MFRRNYQNRKIYGLKAKTYLSVLFLLSIIAIVSVIGITFKKQENITAHYYNKAYTQEQKIRELQTPHKYTDIELAEIEGYIRKVFGKDGTVAVAIAKGECRGLNPNCKLVSKVEYSVCQFQVNLKAHYSKVPGQTLEEKETWLMNTQNCTLMAKVIYDQSGWGPWTSYTSGNYKKYL